MFFKGTLLFFLIYSIPCYSKIFKVVDWENDSLEVLEKTILELEGKKSFETDRFKIVVGRSEEAILFTEKDSMVFLKASTTIYHLIKAEKYFKNLLTKSEIEKVGKVTIRIDITDKFNEQGHFGNSAFEDIFNNAKSIPAGPRVDIGEVAPWGHEIWFRPAKFMMKKSSDYSSADEILEIYELFNKSDYYINLLILTSKIVHGVEFDLEKEIFLIGKEFSIGKLKKEALRKFLYTLNYGAKLLESALIPGIIYHEYIHIVLSKYLSIKHSTPVNEGFANYFASRISKRDQVSVSYSKYSLTKTKNGNSDHSYKTEFELDKYAQDDFTFSLLFQVGELLSGEFNNLKDRDGFFIDLVKSLDSQSEINPTLTDLISNQCIKFCKKPFSQRMKILGLFNNRGL